MSSKCFLSPSLFASSDFVNLVYFVNPIYSQYMGADPRICKKEEMILHTFNICSDSTKLAEFPELSKPVLL